MRPFVFLIILVAMFLSACAQMPENIARKRLEEIGVQVDLQRAERDQQVLDHMKHAQQAYHEAQFRVAKTAIDQAYAIDPTSRAVESLRLRIYGVLGIKLPNMVMSH